MARRFHGDRAATHGWALALQQAGLLAGRRVQMRVGRIRTFEGPVERVMRNGFQFIIQFNRAAASFATAAR